MNSLQDQLYYKVEKILLQGKGITDWELGFLDQVTRKIVSKGVDALTPNQVRHINIIFGERVESVFRKTNQENRQNRTAFRR